MHVHVRVYKIKEQDASVSLLNAMLFPAVADCKCIKVSFCISSLCGFCCCAPLQPHIIWLVTARSQKMSFAKVYTPRTKLLLHKKQQTTTVVAVQKLGCRIKECFVCAFLWAYAL
jgi:hypothetical protein